MGVEVEPKFVYWEKVQRLREELFRRWICNDYNLREFILSSILIRNNKVLLIGFPGSGKSTLVRLIVRGLSRNSGGNKIFGMVIGAPEKTLQKVLITTNIVRLLTSGEEEIIVRPIVQAKIKFINEINRFSKSVQDALLSLLEEGYLEYGGTTFRTPDYICFADMNPFRGDMDRALKARFLGSCYIDLPTMSSSKKIIDALLESEEKMGRYPDIVMTMPSILSIEELRAIWNDVGKVAIPEDVKLFAIMIVAMFRVCKYKRGMVGYMRLKCTECEYSNEPCSYIQEPPDERANLALLLYARARAWLHRRKQVDYGDVIWAAPYVLAHRIEIKPLVKSRVPNPWILIRQVLDEIMKTKWIDDGKMGIWAQSLMWACAALGIEITGPLKEHITHDIKNYSSFVALKNLEQCAYGEFGRGDLVVQQLYEYTKEMLYERLRDIKSALREECLALVNKQGVVLSELEAFESKLKKYPKEIIEEIHGILRQKMNEYKVSFNLEAPVDFQKIRELLLRYDVPMDIVDKLFDKTSAMKLEYKGQVIKLRRIGKNIIIMAQTEEIVDEIKERLKPKLEVA